ncbi:hypothetical protein [Bernardetia sp.]|uniref:hypothetical protein n=1 Tax=Bernardetia sp. TaxID=1937974 RepID=UPI0025BCD404|nr:hypothetical protein [Bernardetia sp.]
MKSLKKKFGKFAVSEKQINRITGGRDCNCGELPLDCATITYLQVPTICEMICCDERA